MCKGSLQFKYRGELRKGLSLIVREIPMEVFRSTIGFGYASAEEDPSIGICIKTGWGLMFKLTRPQLLGLGLPASLGDECGATIFARFTEGTVDYHNSIGTEDRFDFEVGKNGEIVTRDFDKEFLGIRAEVVAMPWEKYPPNRIVKKNREKPVVIPSRTTTAQVLAG